MVEPPGKGHPHPRPYAPTYVARRRLTARDLGVAGGIAAGVAAAAFYFATLWLERTPLEPAADELAPSRERAPARR